MKEGKACCFIGHRSLQESEALREALQQKLEELIKKDGVTEFIFGSRSKFNTLCLQSVTELKKHYPHLRRVYLRAEYPEIDDSYQAYLLRDFEESIFPEKLLQAGKAAYVERNFEMIERSQICIFYYLEEVAVARKSGTKIALDYARKRGKRILLFP